ncbi:MAG: phytoene desaturase [Anaerolineae bacterium]|nr:phytoene desaturase [Anaerolineae bacterium]
MGQGKKALVIGAGLGGIATAGRLARHGYDVTVLEKNNRPGGRCDQLVRDGHRFDTGATLFLMPEIFAETYTALGEEMDEHLDLKRIDPTYSVCFDDGVEISITSNLNEMQAQLEPIEKGSLQALLRYLAEGTNNYHKSVKYFVGRNFYNIFEYFSPKNFPLLFELKALVKHYNRASRFFKDPHLRAAFTFQDMYLGLSPYDALATYSLLQYAEMVNGVYFPVGGLYESILTLVRIVENLGVTFRYSAPVAKILVDGQRTKGVVLAGGEQLDADIVIANADLPYVYRELLPDDPAVKRLDRLKYTCSTIMFFWGTDKVYPEIQHHNVFLSSDYKGSFDRIFKGHGLPQDPSFYVHAPARTDDSAAPEGQDSLVVLVPVGHLDDDKPQDWEALIDHARSTALDRLRTQRGITDLPEHTKFEVVYTPHTWQGLYNLDKGAAFGFSHNFFQVGYLRPQNRHRRYKNLYFVGGSTHPGTGLPMVLLSARLTTERILHDAS